MKRIEHVVELIMMILTTVSSSRLSSTRASIKTLLPRTTSCFEELYDFLNKKDRGKTCVNLKEAYCLRDNSLRVPRTDLVYYVRDFAISFDYKPKTDPATRMRYLERDRPEIPILIYVFHNINTNLCNYEYDDSVSIEIRKLIDKDVISSSKFVRNRNKDSKSQKGGIATTRNRDRDCVLYQEDDQDDTMMFVQVNRRSKVRMEKGSKWIRDAMFGSRADLVHGRWPSDLAPETMSKTEKSSGFIRVERSDGENARLSIYVERVEKKYDETKQLIQSDIEIYSSCGGVDLSSTYVSSSNNGVSSSSHTQHHHQIH